MRRYAVLLTLLAMVSCAAIGAWSFARYGKSLEDISYRLQTIGAVRVDHVPDGDTIVVLPHFGSRKLSVRLLGINAKELEHVGRRIEEECWGPEGRDYARDLAEKKYASLQFDPLKGITEDHDRLLAYVYVYDSWLSGLFGIGGVDLNKVMLETGNAEEWKYKGDYRRSDEFLRAETKAREEKVGGWAACNDFKKHERQRKRRRMPGG